MRAMFKIMRQKLLAGEDLVLVVITASSGAVPRGAGANMLVDGRGRVCGTIGGGAVEYRAEQMARKVLLEKLPARRGFQLNKTDRQDLGMICGGEVEVFFHYLPAGEAWPLTLAERAEEYFAQGKALWLLSDLGRGGALSLYTEEDGAFGAPCPGWLVKHLGQRAVTVKEGAEEFFAEQINSSGRVYIFGGGHVSQELEPLLSRVGFRCVVLDDRAEFAARELFPTAEEVKLVDFRNIKDTVTIGKEDYVCVMTRGHAYDTVVQAQILRCAPRYVGVIGSRSKVEAVRKALKEEHGLTEEELDRVISPVGLSIGAVTPAEIAVSVAAQMIAARAGLDLTRERGLRI